MALSPLAEELQKPEYVGLSDEELIAAFNAKRVVVRRPVENWLIQKTAVLEGYWAAFVIASQRTDIPDFVRGLAINVLAWVGDPSGKIETTDMDLPEVQSMLAAIVQAEFLTQAQADELTNLANFSTPWTETVGLPPIGIGLLSNARLELAALAAETATSPPLENDPNA